MHPPAMTWEERLVHPRRSVLDGALVLGFALIVYAVAAYVVNPQGRFFFGWLYRFSPNVNLFLGHLTWSLPEAILCGAGLAVLVKTGRLRMPSLRHAPLLALRDGVIGGLIVSAATVLLWVAMRGSYMFDINLLKMAGNVVSNFYEEFIYRAFVFAAALYAFRRTWVAALISGVLFGAVHTQYPLPLRAYGALFGAFVAWQYARRGNLIAPWGTHQVSDMILDAILKM